MARLDPVPKPAYRTLMGRLQQRLLEFFSEARKYDAGDFLRAWQFFPAWMRSLKKGANSMADKSPWLTFAAIRHLSERLSVLRGKARVFEWGSGGSTLFFGLRAQEVRAVENDRAWAENVQSVCRKETLPVEVAFRPADEEHTPESYDPSDPEDYRSAAKFHPGHLFRSYVEEIAQYADASFDVVTVDGRARPACLRVGMSKVKPGGLLVLDNAERAWYRRAREMVGAKGWRYTEHTGPGPYNRYFWQTVIWERPLSDHA